MFTRQLIDSNYSFSPCIVWDAVAGKFRLWFNQGVAGSVKFMHTDSTDAVTWSTPTAVRTDNGYGTTVIDEGVAGSQRFKNVNWLGDTAGARAAVSADGLSWSYTGPNPLLPTSSFADVWDLWKNPLNTNYQLFARPTPAYPRRTIVNASSTFPPTSTFVFAFYNDVLDAPATGDPAGNQFYGASNPILFNGVLVSFLRILRDDVNYGTPPSPPGSSSRGTGHTVLAWSRDGIVWFRSRKPFFQGERGSWDQAIAWVYGAVVKDGVLYLSYAGYDTGHKSGNRGIGIASMLMSEFTLED